MFVICTGTECWEVGTQLCTKSFQDILSFGVYPFLATDAGGTGGIGQVCILKELTACATDFNGSTCVR